LPSCFSIFYKFVSHCINMPSKIASAMLHVQE
jgi:hypothetical protein